MDWVWVGIEEDWDRIMLGLGVGGEEDWLGNFLFWGGAAQNCGPQ